MFTLTEVGDVVAGMGKGGKVLSSFGTYGYASYQMQHTEELYVLTWDWQCTIEMLDAWHVI